MASSSDELKALYIKSMDKGDTHSARQWCNFAGVGPFDSDKCFREDFTPEQQQMWVKLYDFCMNNHSLKGWPELRETLG